jgi:hypothetical protein
VGRPALDVWDDLSLLTKVYVTTQVARHLMSISELRFAHAGSLYLSPNGSSTVGLIVHAKYFKTMDGMPVYTDARAQHKLHQFRGPFSNTADWLSSPMKAEIFALSSTPPPSPSCVGEHRPDDSSLALKSMNKAVRLCSEYPGNNPVISTTWVSTEPFSFMFDDFSLSNFMV